MSFQKMRLRHLVRQGHKKAILVDRLLKKADRLLGTILVGNNLVNVAASVVTGALATHLVEPVFGPKTAMFTATLIMTLLLLIFSEITPKTIARQHVEKVSFLVARPIQWVSVFLAPFVWITTLVSNFLLKTVLRVKPIKSVISPEEIRSIISYGEESGVLEKEKREMLHGIFDISETIVKEVMVPRPDIIAIELGTSLDEILRTTLETGHSRYPVYNDQIDDIAGLLYVKDLLPFWSKPDDFLLEKVLRKGTFVPETKRVDQLISEFRKEKRHITIVADEYGSVAGMVTMEDLLEEITGEIQDEYDMEYEKVERLSDGSLILDGSLTIGELLDRTGIRLPEGEYDTIAGFLLDNFGKIPKESEQISYGQHLIAAEKLDRHRIVKVKINPLPPTKKEI